MRQLPTQVSGIHAPPVPHRGARRSSKDNRSSVQPRRRRLATSKVRGLRPLVPGFRLRVSNLVAKLYKAYTPSYFTLSCIYGMRLDRLDTSSFTRSFLPSRCPTSREVGQKDGQVGHAVSPAGTTSTRAVQRSRSCASSSPWTRAGTRRAWSCRDAGRAAGARCLR